MSEMKQYIHSPENRGPKYEFCQDDCCSLICDNSPAVVVQIVQIDNLGVNK